MEQGDNEYVYRKKEERSGDKEQQQLNMEYVTALLTPSACMVHPYRIGCLLHGFTSP